MRERKRELASLSAGAGEHVRRGNCTVARERTGKDRAMREEKGSESSVMRTVIRSDRNRKERTVERTVSYGVREKWRRGF